MHRRRFGRTGLSMPVFSCGGMRFQASWTLGDRFSADSQKNLERCVDVALDHGLNHFETARGYGTSEEQLGRALARHARDRLILQTKIAPREDPREFEKNLEESYQRLRVDRLDLFAFHGLNDQRRIERLDRCFEVVERHRARGRIGHVGFSTHGNLPTILRLIESDRFDYVNLHWYFIFQENFPAIAAAARHDMGVFIISPTDKGGHLHSPRPLWVQACAPLHPMQFNDLFCLSHEEVHTLSLGAARPTDFDLHLAVLPMLARAGSLVAPIAGRLQGHMNDAIGTDYAATYLDGLPEWEDLPGGVNVRRILWLHNVANAWDLIPYARTRYNMLSTDDHWFPGNKAVDFDAAALDRALFASPHRARIPGLLREAHALLDDGASIGETSSR